MGLSAGLEAGKRMGPRALGTFVRALERGDTVLEAARKAGVHASSFYRRRQSCPGFAEAWDEAVSRSDAPLLIAAGNKRRLQKRKSRRIRFTRDRKEKFIAHFAATCDQKASAEAAGVCASTVDKHLARDPEFAAAWQAALEVGYAALEAELLRQQRAAHEAHRQRPEPAYRVAPDPEAAAAAKDFERSLQLLIAWRRRDGRIGRRDSPSGDPRQRWSFDEAMALLEKKLNALAARSNPRGRKANER